MSCMKNFDNCQTLYTVGQAVGVDMPRERSQSNRKESAEILEDIAEEEDLIIIGSDPIREERNDESSSETLKSVIPGILHNRVGGSYESLLVAANILLCTLF